MVGGGFSAYVQGTEVAMNKIAEPVADNPGCQNPYGPLPAQPHADEQTAVLVSGQANSVVLAELDDREYWDSVP
jgi:hypothetical protein